MFWANAIPKADWSRRLRNTQVSPCLSSVNLCTCVQATQRGAQTKETREMCSCSETNKNLYSVHITFGAKNSNFVFCGQTPRRAHLPRDTRTSFCRVHVDQGESQTCQHVCAQCALTKHYSPGSCVISAPCLTDLFLHLSPALVQS